MPAAATWWPQGRGWPTSRRRPRSPPSGNPAWSPGGGSSGELDLPPERLFDDIERVGEFAEFDHAAVSHPQKICELEAQQAAARALLKRHLRHHGGSVTFDQHHLRFIARELIVPGDAAERFEHRGLAAPRAHEWKNIDRRVDDPINVVVDIGGDTIEIATRVGVVQSRDSGARVLFAHDAFPNRACSKPRFFETVIKNVGHDRAPETGQRLFRKAP